MEKIGEMALAYYEKSSDEVKKAAQNFFKSMDTDGNGSIGKNEFRSFMDEKSMKFRPDLFAELDRDGNGSLDFNEVITFYYMTFVRNLFCDCCEKYLSQEYYTCVKCFLDRSCEKKFIICFACYRSKKYSGTEHTSLLDNYVMLNSMQSDSDRKNLEKQFSSHNGKVWTTKEIAHASIKTAKVAIKVTEAVAVGSAAVAVGSVGVAAGTAAIAGGATMGTAAAAAGTAALSAVASTSVGAAAVAAGTAAVASGTAAMAAGTAAVAGGASLGPVLIAAGTAAVVTCTIM